MVNCLCTLFLSLPFLREGLNLNLSPMYVIGKVNFLGLFLNKPPILCSKVHLLRAILSRTQPKKPAWKIEPSGCIRADTVVTDFKTDIYFIKLQKNLTDRLQKMIK